MSPTAHEMELEPEPPDPSELCPVCGKLDCVCPADSEKQSLEKTFYRDGSREIGKEDAITRSDIQTTGEKIPFFRRRKQ